MSEIALLGIFRSGTNFTRTLLELNYDVDVKYNTYGWKHGMIPTYEIGSNMSYPIMDTLVVIKDPYAIFDSWYRFALEKQKHIHGNLNSLHDFILNPVYYTNESNVLKNIAPEYYFSNPVQMWNSVVWNHLSFVRKQGGMFVTYEVLLSDPVNTLERIAKKFDMKQKTDILIMPKNIMKKMTDKPDRNEEYHYMKPELFTKKDYLLEKKFMELYSEFDLKFIAEQLAPELLNQLDYDNK